MQFETFYHIKMPMPLEKALLRTKKIKSNGLIMECPTKDFSPESYQFFYMDLVDFLNDTVGKEFATKYLHKCKIYQVVKENGEIIDRKQVA